MSSERKTRSARGLLLGLGALMTLATVHALFGPAADAAPIWKPKMCVVRPDGSIGGCDGACPAVPPTFPCILVVGCSAEDGCTCNYYCS